MAVQTGGSKVLNRKECNRKEERELISRKVVDT